MASKIPVAKFDGSRRSPVRSPGRSPGSSPGKSPGRDSVESPWKTKPQSPSRAPPSVLKSNQTAGSPSGGSFTSRGRNVVKKVTLQSPGEVIDGPGMRGHQAYGRGETANIRVGVRYITEDMIKKMSKQDNMMLITSLNLTMTSEDGKKIKYIENLERLKKLQTLNLSCNMIEKIEKMDKLTRLRDLNLSYNCLTKLDGLESLTMLQALNVSGNSIEHIPPWFSKKLKALRTLKLANNQIQSIQELTRLRPLRDLTQITVGENPVSSLPHCRSFLVFHLRTLESLDSQSITGQERTAAHSRFAQEELEKLQQQLEKQQEIYDRLKQDHNKSIGEIEQKDTKVKEIESKSKLRDKQVKELRRELETKNDLLKRKTSELTKACHKHYELEQELAFYKIDHKFEELARPPAPASDSDQMTDDGLIGDESPYLGKGRFKKNEMLRKQQELARQAQQGAREGQRAEGYGFGEGQGLSYEEIQAKAHMNKTMDRELEDKHHAITGAQEKLQDLQMELQLTERQLQQATDELQKISEVSHGRPLTEDDKQDIRNALGRKVDKVHQLRRTANDIENEIDSTRDDLNQQQREVGKLRGKLKRMGSRDSLYNLVKKEVSEKEKQLEITAQQYNDLQRQLEGMLYTIAREAEDIKNLEHDLRDGQVARSDEIREELEGIIQGLQAYLGDVQRKADQQRDQYDILIADKQQLEERLREAEEDRQLMEQQAHEISTLRDKLVDLEDSMMNEREMNNSLQNHLEESRQQQQSDVNLSQRLQDTETDLNKLRQTLKSAEKKRQREKEDYEKKLESDHKKLDQLKGRAREANMKEDEIRNLHNQLTNLQISNAGLQDQVYDCQKKLQEQQKKALNPDSLRDRLADITTALQSGRKTKGGRPGPNHRDNSTEPDPVEEVLEEMEDKIHSELEKSFKDVEKAKREKDRAEADVMALKDKIVQVQDKEREMAEQAIQTMMDEERQESEKLRRQIDRLRAELERERELHRERAQILPSHLLEPSPKSQSRRSTTATGTTSVMTTDWSEEDSSTIPSSQWSQKKQDIYDTMSPEEQDLFDELQSEIEELRKLLMMKGKDKEFVEKASQAAQTAALLRNMIETRHTASDSQADTRTSGSGAGGHRSRNQGAGQSSQSHGPLSKSQQAKDPNVRKVLKELDRAQGEIQTLQDQLHRRNAIVKEEMVRSDRTNHAITAQQQEIGQLHEVLQEQKEELDNLTEALDVLRSMRPDHPLTRDQMNSASRGYAHQRPGPMQFDDSPRHHDRRLHAHRDMPQGRSRSTDREHGHISSERGQGWLEGNGRGIQDRGRTRERQRDRWNGDSRGQSLDRGRSLDRQREGWTGERRGRSSDRGRSLDRQRDGWRREEQQFVDDQGYPYYDDQMDRGYSGDNDGAYSPRRAQRGSRPVPIFYSPDGQEIPFPDEDYLDDGQQYHGYGPPGYDDVYQRAAGQGIHPAGPYGAGHGPSNMVPQPVGVSAFPGGHNNIVPQGQGNIVPPGMGVQTAIGGPHGMAGQVPGAPFVPRSGPLPGAIHPGAGAVTIDAQGNIVPAASSAGAVPGGPGMMPGGPGMMPGGPGMMPGGPGMMPGGPGMMPGGPGMMNGPAAPMANIPQGQAIAANGMVQTMLAQAPGTQNVLAQPHPGFNPQTPQGKGAGIQVAFLPSTPGTGPQMGQVLSAPNTPAATVVQPMMSTPVAGGGDGLTGGQIKGILKKGGGTADNMDLNDRLLCNVPEHHDLEDYIDQLQNKVKRLKSRLEEEQETNLEDSKRVLFEQDKEKQMIKRLKKELKEKRQELDSLDLAVEHQKSHLTKMKRQEQVLKVKGKAARDELTRVESGYPRTTHAKRQAFFSSGADFEVSDSDYDYDYSSYDGHDRKSFVQQEILSLEDTLAKRRAELRAADRLLTECELDLSDAQNKAKDTIQKYQTAREGYKSTVKDLEDIELRAQDSGSTLVKAKEQLRLVQLDTEQHRQQKLQYESTLNEIQQVISNKEAEMNNLEAKFKQTSKRLQDVQYEIHSTEKDSERLVMERRKEVEHLQNKISEERSELDKIRRQIAREKSEFELTEESLRKRRQLESLDKDLSTEVDRRRKELKDLDRQLGELHHERRKYDQELKQEESQLDRMHSEGQKRTMEVDTLQRKISTSHTEVDSLHNRKRSLEGTVTSLHSDKVALEQSAKELHNKIGDLKRTQGHVESDIDARHQQLASLELELRRVEQVLDTVTRGHSSLSQELQGIQSHVKDGRSDLEDVRSNLKGARANMRHLEQNEENKRSQSEASYNNLQERLRNLAQDIISRESEKERLNAALDRSCQESHELHKQVKKEREEVGQRLHHFEGEARCLRQELDDRNKELHHIRKKSANEIADLEGIAQAHCSRANRLSDELSYLRAEYLEIKRKLDSQQEISEREKRLENSIKDLKSDIKYEVADTIMDQEKEKQVTLTELGELHDQKHNLSSQLTNLKQSLSLTRSQDSGISLNTDSHTESFAEHQTFLKSQLAAKMARQDELLKAQRQISQDNILNLQRKLSNLEQVFSQADSVGANPVGDPVTGRLHRPCDLFFTPATDGFGKETTSSSQDSETREVPKRAYSPHRYSNNRSSWHSTACDVPEKDAS